MDVTTHRSVDRFSGINNVDSAERLFPVSIDHRYVYPLREANNVEIDNTFKISSRSGYTSVQTGSDIHSMWSDNSTWLYVDGGTLYEMDVRYSATALRSELTVGARMSYAVFNDRIYFTNGYEIGYVKANAANSLPAPDRAFKEPLPAGQLIEYFMGCLYVAKDDTLYISDPLCDYYDIRRGYRRFANKITLLRGVDDGIYVSDNKVWFMPGKGNEDFERKEAYPHKAIIYTDVMLPGSYISEQISGNVAMWTGENGICLGDNSGGVLNLTEERYTFPARGRGTGFIRDSANVRHYINSLF